jgi:hypothetical protein
VGRRPNIVLVGAEGAAHLIVQFRAGNVGEVRMGERMRLDDAAVPLGAAPEGRVIAGRSHGEEHGEGHVVSLEQVEHAVVPHVAVIDTKEDDVGGDRQAREHRRQRPGR